MVKEQPLSVFNGTRLIKSSPVLQELIVRLPLPIFKVRNEMETKHWNEKNLVVISSFP